MGAIKCMVCDDKLACRAVDEELEKGMSGAAVARLMTLRGFQVTAPTINEHNKHRQPMATPDVARTKKDLATLLRDKIMEKVENNPEFDILDKEVQPALKTGLMAEGLIDKRVARTDDKKAAIQIAVLLAGGPAGLLAPPDLRGDEDDNVIDGEAVEVD